MAKSDIGDFKDACNEHRPSASERAQEADVVWLMGVPTRSEDGMLGVATESGATISFGEDDLLDVERHEDSYLVKVRRNAQALINFESAVSLDGSGSSCECDGSSSDEKVAALAKKPEIGGIPIDDLIIPTIPWDDIHRCRLVPVWKCHYVWVRLQDRWHRICLPYLRYEIQCW